MYLEASFRVAIFLRRESQYIWKKKKKKSYKSFQQQSSQFPGKSPPGHSPAGIPEYNHYVRKTLWKAKKEKRGLFVLDTFCFDANT